MSQQQQQSNPQPLGSDKAPPPQAQERYDSVDSAACFEPGDEYDDYDDFGANTGGGGGGSKVVKRREERGGGGGSNTIYSAKHIRAKEVQHQQQSSNKSNKNAKQGK